MSGVLESTCKLVERKHSASPFGPTMPEGPEPENLDHFRVVELTDWRSSQRRRIADEETALHAPADRPGRAPGGAGHRRGRAPPPEGIHPGVEQLWPDMLSLQIEHVGLHHSYGLWQWVSVDESRG